MAVLIAGCSSTPGVSPDSEPQQVGKNQGESIAVLPFVNMSGSPDGEGLANDVTESVIGALSDRGSDVASSSDSSRFKNINTDIREIAETLGVEFLVEGSVRSSGERIRITAQLIRVSDGYHLWSETYDLTMSDLPTIQQEIGGAVANALSSQ